jgi:hypothetical protein
MNRIFRRAVVAAFAAATCMMAVAVDASAATQSSTTQELSARTCRTIVTHYWRHGRRIAVRRTSCRPSYAYVRPACRYVVKYRWSNGHRVTVRTRVC